MFSATNINKRYYDNWIQHDGPSPIDGQEKLHIAAEYQHFMGFTRQPKFNAFIKELDQAINAGIIPAFKYLDPDYDPATSIERTKNRIAIFHSLLSKIQSNKYDIQEISNQELEIYQSYFDEGILNESPEQVIYMLKSGIEKNQEILNAKYRLYNNPITIYLSEKPDIKAIMNLCQKLENDFDFPIVNNCLSVADLPTHFKHISYRYESIDGIYITIQTASQDKLNQLKELGKKSPLYQALSQVTSNQLSHSPFILFNEPKPSSSSTTMNKETLLKIADSKQEEWKSYMHAKLIQEQLIESNKNASDHDIKLKQDAIHEMNKELTRLVNEITKIESRLNQLDTQSTSADSHHPVINR